MADNEVLEAVKGLTSKVEKRLEDSTEESKKVKQSISDFEKAAKEADQKITEFTEDLKKKGATIGELQGEIKELKSKKLSSTGDRVMTVKHVIADMIGEHKQNFLDIEKGGTFKTIETKTVGNIVSANLTGTGNNYITYLGWMEGMEPIDQARFRSFVRTVQSETDFVRYPRANVPVGEGSFAKVAEGSAKPQVDRDYTMIDLTLQYIAGWSTVSRSSMRNIKFLQSWLPTSMLEQLLDQEDLEFANTLVAAASGSSTTTGTKQIDKLVHYVRNLRKKKFKPNGIAVDPDIWSAIILNTETSAGFNLPNVCTVTPDGTVRLLGIPIVPVNWLTGGRVIVGEWGKAAIVESEGLVMRQSDSHASEFISNNITFLLERCEGLMINRPDAFITGVIS